MVQDIERFTPDLRGQIAYEHRHRYALCKNFVADKVVLDVACGEGYGSDILAAKACRVVGVDLDQETIARAAQKYGANDRLEFKVGNCASLPFADESFDVVVSFETIEHIKEQFDFVNEVSRVLKKNGTFIVSTPNRPVYSEETSCNPFHIKELDESEFRDLLGNSFKHVYLLGQRLYIPSLISGVSARDAGNGKATYHGLVVRDDVVRQMGDGSAKIRHAQYFVAFCSNKPIRRKIEAPSIFIDETDDLWREQQKVLRWASGLHEEDEHLRKRLRDSEARLNKLVNVARGPHVSEELVRALKRELVILDEIKQIGANTQDLLRQEILGTLGRIASDHEIQSQAIQTVERELERVRDALHETQRAYRSAEDEIARYSQELVAEREERRTMAQELAALREASGAQAEAAAVALDDAKANLLAQVDELALLRKEAAIARDEIGRLEAASTELTNENEQHRLELEGKTRALEKYSKAVLADRKTFERFKEQARIASLKQALDAQLAAAAPKVRIGLGRPPLSPVFERSRLRLPLPVTIAERRLSRSERRDVKNVKLFDPAWYLAQNPDVAERRVDPFAHFISHGLAEHRDPHPLFSCGWYLATNPDVLSAKCNPFAHFIRFGASELRSPHPLFNPRYYLETNKDVTNEGEDPLTHFLRRGARERRDPHPLIWMKRLADQAGFAGSENPLIDYLSNPELFLASPHPLFDGEFYLSENKDVLHQTLNPALHYCVVGWREGRQPHRVFAGDWYLANNPDLLAAQCNPLEHFVRFGAFEGRSPHPLFDVGYYLNHCRDARESSCDALSHYVMKGARDQLETTDKITVESMRQTVPEAYWQTFAPISAFMYFGPKEIFVPAHVGEVNFDFDQPETYFWPPVPDPVYWLPQKLRDYIIDRNGEKCGLYVYLMSVVERYGDSHEAFTGSSDFGILSDRLRILVAKKCSRCKPIDVSIVIPVYNNLVFTLTCVLSLLENDTRFSIEIIIGDDCSTDATHEVFAAAGGNLTVVRHETTLGFLDNCNAAANVAKGRCLVFLNNDTLMLPNWLDELVGALEQDERIGLAGSKLLNADGTLQEAGGIFWRDGSAWNFGRNSDPRLPEFNYRRDVDYVSGASIALPTSVWRALGGFDPIYAPAYCEDADIAFRVRRAGLRTVYVPRSELVHHEGKSHGRDTSGGIKAYQVVNQQKLVNRWRDVLQAEHFPNGEDVFLARDRSRDKPHLLFIDHYIPQWDRDAGSRCMLHYLRMFLTSGFQITFWPDNLNDDREYCAPLQDMGVEVIYSATYADRFDNFMATNGRYFGYALLSRPHIAIKYYGSIQAHSHCKVIYVGHDIHFRRMELALATNNDPDLVHEIDDMRALELDNWRRADVVLYFSVEERDEVRRLQPTGTAEQTPLYGYEREELLTARANVAHFDDRKFDELVFVGGTHPPNVDAMRWFASEVFPLILRERPRTRLQIVGSTTSPDVERLESDAILVRGRLSDAELTELYRTAGVAVIPLRFGAGVKGKTVEALFNAIPVVTTSIGIQGLAPREPIGFVADDAEAFAKAVVTAQTERDESKANVLRGLDFLEENYSIEALRRAFQPFMPEVTALPAEVESCESRIDLPQI